MQQGEFITSDTHFFHKNILKYTERHKHFSTIDDMVWEFVKRWNEKIHKDAVVYHLGDFAFAKTEKIHYLLSHLNGKIRLLYGNHDKPMKKSGLPDRFDWVKEYHESKCPDGTLVVMCHYPLLSWNKKHYGSIHLHGHCHTKINHLNTDQKRFDVGVDNHPNYEPFSYNEIRDILDKRPIGGVDRYQRREAKDESL